MKLGFSLGEVLMTLLIICAVAVLSAPFLAKKTDLKIKHAHGRYECKAEGAQLKETYYDSKQKILKTETTSVCSFITPDNANNFTVDICGADPKTACRDEDGSHVFMFYHWLPKVTEIKFEQKIIKFGKFAFAFRKDTGGRLIVVW